MVLRVKKENAKREFDRHDVGKERLNVILTSSVATRGGFGGLSPPKQSSKPPKLKYETL